MKQFVGVIFLVLTTVLTLMFIYSMGMGIIGHYGFFGVAVGIALSAVMAFIITRICLK